MISTSPAHLGRPFQCGGIRTRRVQTRHDPSANGNLIIFVWVAEALRNPIMDNFVRAIRWNESGKYVLDAWPLEHADTAGARKFLRHGGGWKIMALTSLSWILPVELTTFRL